MFRAVPVVLTAIMLGLMAHWVSQLAQLVGPSAVLVVVTIVANAVL